MGAVSPSKTVMDEGYDIPALSRDLDIINVMTYDYHGHWDKKTGHVAPLYAHPDDEFYYFNANYTMHYWAEKGADKRKLMMGMPMYGQAFSLASAAANQGLNAPAPGRGQAGEFTRAGGFLAYYEICHKVQYPALCQKSLNLLCCAGSIWWVGCCPGRAGATRPDRSGWQPVGWL